MTKTRTKRATPAQRRDATDARPPVDHFKRFHFAAAIAPAFAAEYVRWARPAEDWKSVDDWAEEVTDLADALARHVDRKR